MLSKADSTISKIEHMSDSAQLLYLKVRDGEVDPDKIYLLKIIEDYLSFLLVIHPDEINLEIVSNFLVAVSELVLWKSYLLLPSSPKQNTVEDESENIYLQEDYWKEYKKYQVLAEMLAAKEGRQREIYLTSFKALHDLRSQPAENDYTDLMLAFEAVLNKNKNQNTINLKSKIDNVEKKIQEIEEIFSKYDNKLTFSQIISQGNSRIEIIIIFLALLHLICQNRVDYKQTQNFAEIVFYRKEDEKSEKKKIQ